MYKLISLFRYLLTVCIFYLIITMPALSQLPESASTVIKLSEEIRVYPNITYHVANNWEAKLDLYLPSNAEGPFPTLIYYHWGGWVFESKESRILFVLPYLEMGFAVVNVEYRLAKISPAPAAVVDCICALRWVNRNAQRYNFDPLRIVLSGRSAGGHLALIVGMIPPEEGLSSGCATMEEMLNNALVEVKVAAIINWFGITDVADIANGENSQLYAQIWLSGHPDPIGIAQKVSPIRYIRPGLPPVLTIHGDEDPYVPYHQAVRLHEALDEVNVPNRLVTISGGKHLAFNLEENLKIYQAIRDFLSEQGIWHSRKSP